MLRRGGSRYLYESVYAFCMKILESMLPWTLSRALSLLLLSASCQLVSPPKDKSQEALHSLLQADADFSKMVQEKGYRQAFLEYMENDAVLLRNQHRPMVGADAVKYVTGFNDTTFTVSWDPQGGDVAASEDLGYTWGIYTIQTQANSQKGSYLCVWRKQTDGRWKFTHDATTQGIALSKAIETTE